MLTISELITVNHDKTDLVLYGKGMRVPAPIMWKAVTGGWWLSCSMYTTVPSESCACHVSPSMGLKGFRQDWKTCCSPATNLHAFEFTLLACLLAS